MNDPANTTPEMLLARRGDRPARTACSTVYAGNLPGRVGDLEHTRCHGCRALLIERYGYLIQRLPDHERRRLPRLRHGDSRPMGSRLRGRRSPTAHFFRDAPAAGAVVQGSFGAGMAVQARPLDSTRPSRKARRGLTAPGDRRPDLNRRFISGPVMASPSAVNVPCCAIVGRGAEEPRPGGSRQGPADADPPDADVLELDDGREATPDEHIDRFRRDCLNDGTDVARVAASPGAYRQSAPASA